MSSDADRNDGADPERPPYANEPPLVKSVALPRRVLDEQAVFVVKRLQSNGHEAYLVGGCVRDLLAGLEPKDFDVATDAYPNRIKRLFRSARVIGRRFRLVHVHFPANHIIETATFRGDPKYRSLPDADATPYPDQGGRRGRDWRQSVENIFGTAPEDAQRRDFTINALFYDPVRESVIDYVGGLADMEAGIVRSIGTAETRIAEDPVRMLRAVHFARRLDYQLDPALEAAIEKHAQLLDTASQARLYIELIKLLTRGRAHSTLKHLRKLGVFQVWLPKLSAALDVPATWPTEAGGTHAEASQGEPEDLPVAHATWNLLGAADEAGLAARGASEALALAVLFGPWIRYTWAESEGVGFHQFLAHCDDVFGPVALRMSIPKNTTYQLRDMLWLLDQLREAPERTKALDRIMRRPAFGDALRLLELDLMARDADLAPVKVWRDLAEDAGIDPEAKPQPRERSGGRNRGGQGGGRGGRGRSRGGQGRGRGGRGRRGGRDRGGGGGGGPPREEAGAWTPPPPPSDS